LFQVEEKVMPDSYQVFSPITESTNERVSLAPSIPDLSGKTICAIRRTFRADETFPMIEELLREKYNDIRFIPNTEMPDLRPTNAAEAAELTRVLREKRCDVLLAGNGA
jgi:ABC-type amino acid transport substrate-binding protein